MFMLSDLGAITLQETWYDVVVSISVKILSKRAEGNLKYPQQYLSSHR